MKLHVQISWPAQYKMRFREIADARNAMFFNTKGGSEPGKSSSVERRVRDGLGPFPDHGRNRSSIVIRQISWQAQHFVNLHVQNSWQVQHFVNLHVQISWQAQHFVNLHVQSLSQAQHFVNLEVQISCRHSTLRTSMCRLRTGDFVVQL